MGTYSARLGDIEKKWFVIDAEGLVLGRLATIVANRLRGKHKPTFTPHMDDGDHVIVVNCEKIELTGNKRSDKRFYWHSGYPGGIKSRSMAQILDGAHPERVVEKAVQRMIPSGPLGRQQLTHLKVYSGPEHPHAAQNPEVLDIRSMNPKNVRRA
jgi:large subunit ribosomal protein L13